MPTRARLALRLFSVAVVAGGVALAAGPLRSSLANPKRPVLHEPLPAPAGDSAPSPMLGKDPGDANPAAIAAGDKVLPAPPLNAPPRDPKEPVLGTKDFGADRVTESTPDRSTGADSTLHYASVFNPDVVPFKRMSSLDGVREDYTLFVKPTGETDLPVGGATDRSRDRFWGSMLIKLAPGNEVPLPSVAPDMRILSYETEPKVRLTFSKDGADNFFVRSDDSGSSGTYRLVFLADADAGYFAPQLPANDTTPRQVLAAAPVELRPQLPPKVKAVADRILRDKLKIDADYRLEVAFNALVRYFRAFEAKQAPPNKGDIYRDLCLSQAGVCRHRAFAFMITANALGIPTRFISNEAHAFVEVWLPTRNWQRVDLGGAALRLDVSGGDGKTLHRPRAEDPFAKPDAYTENYTQLSGDIRGLSTQQISDRQRPTNAAPASGDFEPNGAPGSGPGSGLGSGSGSGSGSASSPPDPDTTGRITPDKSKPVARADPAKRTPVLTITSAATSAYRGGKLHVEGRAVDGSAPLPSRPIDIYLSQSGSHGANALFLKRVLTGADGTFSVDVEVPAKAKLAPHELHISTPADDTYNGALSE
jgi:transglutaminase-like putative cysteine protease